MPFLELKSASEGMSVENEKLALTKMKLLEHLMSVEIKLLVNSCFVPNSMNRVGTSVLTRSWVRTHCFYNTRRYFDVRCQLTYNNEQMFDLLGLIRHHSHVLSTTLGPWPGRSKNSTDAFRDLNPGLLGGKPLC